APCSEESYFGRHPTRTGARVRGARPPDRYRGTGGPRRTVTGAVVQRPRRTTNVRERTRLRAKSNLVSFRSWLRKWLALADKVRLPPAGRRRAAANALRRCCRRCLGTSVNPLWSFPRRREVAPRPSSRGSISRRAHAAIDRA